MQTFLPYPDFARSAACLDNRRLGKQRVEAKQILLALKDPNYGWQNHPAVKMWRGDIHALACYGFVVCNVWRTRGFKDSLLSFFMDNFEATFFSPRVPSRFDERFCAAHRSNLLRKDPVWYGQFGWTEPADLPYVWPVK